MATDQVVEVIADTLADKEYVYDYDQELYRKELRGGEIMEVDFDLRDNTVNVTRLNSRNVQLNFRSFSLTQHRVAQDVANMV